MNVEDAIAKACADIGIIPPKGRDEGRWLKTDTLSGKNGKGDGRVKINDACVNAFNWQTGENVTVWMKDAKSPEVRRQVREDIRKQQAERVRRAQEAAGIAARIVAAAELQTHPYLAAKGFPDELAFVADAAVIAKIGGKYLLPEEGGASAIVIPARIGSVVRSVQLIWESGEKKFLANGEMQGASHRIATGRDPWHCEGFATGLTLRAALKALRHNATVLVCFSASNVETIAKTAQGRSYIVTDNDKPIPQYDGLGAGEFFARRSGVPYLLPPAVGDDLNDIHQREGLFAVQRLICDFLKGARS